jgi:hypothetical protein
MVLAMMFTPGMESMLKAAEPNGTVNDSVLAGIDEHTPATKGLERLLGDTCPVRYDLPADMH